MIIPLLTRHRRTAIAIVVGAVLFSWPLPVDAQARRGRIVRPVVVTPGVYRPFYGPFFHHPYFWGFPGWHPFWGFPMMFPMGPEPASARLRVTPKDTEVYLDGRLVGVVDDFDGRFQRLRVPPGQYVLELYREGTRLWQRPVLLTPGSTLNIEHRMEPLDAGEPAPQRPEPPAQTTQTTPSGPAQSSPAGTTRDVGRAEKSSSAVSVLVEPTDAEVVIDGQSWGSPSPGTRLLVHVSAGRHQLVVRKPGYQPYDTEIEVAAGTTRTVNVSLRER